MAGRASGVAGGTGTGGVGSNCLRKRSASLRRRASSLDYALALALAGAYCAAMSTINYNSYPQAPEVMLEPDGTLRLLRRRQDLDQVWGNEV